MEVELYIWEHMEIPGFSRSYEDRGQGKRTILALRASAVREVARF